MLIAIDHGNKQIKTVHTQLRRGKAFLRQQLERSESHEDVP